MIVLNQEYTILNDRLRGESQNLKSKKMAKHTSINMEPSIMKFGQN